MRLRSAIMAVLGLGVISAGMGQSSGYFPELPLLSGNSAPTVMVPFRSPYPLSVNPANPDELSLQQAVLLALHNNPNLNVSINNRRLQLYDLLVAQEAFRPQVSLASSGTYSQYSDNQGNASINRQASIGPQVNWTLPLGTQISSQFGYTPANQTSNAPSTSEGTTWTVSITQPLLQNFGVDVNEVALNNAVDQQTIDTLQLKNTVISTIMSTISDYYALAQAQQNYNIALASLEDKKETLFIREQNFKAGRIPGTDVTEAKLDITSQQQSVEQAKLAVNAARQQLITTDLGLPEDTRFKIIDDLTVDKIIPPTSTLALQEALKNNLDIQISRLQYQQQQRNLLTSENQQRWTLDVVASRTRSNQSSQLASLGVITNSNVVTNNSSISLNLSIPLNQTTIDQQALSASTAMDNAQISMNNTERTLASNLTNAIASLNSLWTSLQISEENLKLAQINTQAAEIKFSYGKLDAFTLSQQQEQLESARMNVINSKVSYLKQVLTYQQLMGSLLQEWHVEFKEPDHV